MAGTIVIGAPTIGALDQETAGQIVIALHALAEDLQKTVGDAWKLAVLLAPIVTVWLAKAGHAAAGPKRQTAAVQALPEAQAVVTDPKLAECIPGVQVKPR